MSKNKEKQQQQQKNEEDILMKDNEEIENEMRENDDGDNNNDDQQYTMEELDPTFSPALFSYMRRATQRPPAKKNDIYLSNNGNFLYYIKRTKKLLFVDGIKEINLHGLGAAIMPTIKLALYLQRRFDLVISPNTSTEVIIDQYEPNVDYVDPVSKTRHCSAIHIKVSKQ